MDARSALTKFNVLTARPNDNTNGLLGWYPFDDGTALDWSGNQNNGTLVSGPTVIPGIIGNALNFNGSTQYVNTGIVPSPTNLSSGTLMCWIKPTNAYNSGVYDGFAGCQLSTGLSQLTFFHYISNVIYGGWVNAGTDTRATVAASATNWVQGQWQHYALTWVNGGSTIIYRNGVQIASAGGCSVSSLITNPLAFGFLNGAPGDYFNGGIDDGRIYVRALSAGEIHAIYNQGIAYQQGQPEGELPTLYLAQTSPFLINPLIITQEQPVLHPFPMVATRSIQGPNVGSPERRGIVVSQESPFHPLPNFGAGIQGLPTLISPAQRGVLVTQEVPFHPLPTSVRGVQGPNVGTPEIRRIITSQEQTEYYSTRPITRAGVYTTGFNPVWAIKSNIIFPGPAGT